MGKFVERNLSRNEELICKVKVHWASLIPHVALMFIIIGFITIIKPLIGLFTTELGLTTKRLIGKVGLINTKSMDAPLNKINNITIQSGLWGKIFGYGTIYVTTSSGSYYYKHVARPEIMRQAIMNQIDEYENDRIKQQAREMANAMQSVAATK